MEIRGIDLDADYEELMYSFKLRESDYAELEAYSGNNPYHTMLDSIHACKDPCCIVDDAGKIICVFGINDYMYFDVGLNKVVKTKLGIPWLLASEKFTKHALYIARHAKKVFRETFKKHIGLFNFVDSRNTKSIRFLKALGFTVEFDFKMPFADDKVNFYMFHMLRHDFKFKTLDDYIKAQGEGFNV